MKLAEIHVPLVPEPGQSSRQNKNGHAPAAMVRMAGKQRDPINLGGFGQSFKSDSSERALFHVNSLVGQVWLLQLRKRIQASYRNASNPQCPLQTGYAWRSFSVFFEPLSAIEMVRLFENLLRFASFEGYPPARAFFFAYAPLAFEHDSSGEFIGPGVWSPPSDCKKAVRRVRRTLQRWCEWLEALTHLQVHCEFRHEAPRQQLDKAVILLWPLVRRHQWSSSDLLSVLRSLTNHGTAFVPQTEQQLAVYCRTALGLSFPGRPRLRGEGALPGWIVAERLFKLIPTVA